MAAKMEMQEPRQRQDGELPIVARYVVASTVAPSITQVISVADRVHDALCKCSDQSNGRAAVFTGLVDNGKPRGDHAHAHIFCETNGECETITNLVIWATMGFNDGACLALHRLNRIWGYGGHDIRLVLKGIGQPNDFKDCALFGPSQTWRSRTPFVSTRHAKRFRDGRPKMAENGWQIGSGGHDLLRMLALHPHGADATIKQLDERERPFQFGNRSLRSQQFQTTRYDGNGNRGNSSGNAFSVTFSKAIAGPLAFGYGSHFGLGLFVPAE